MASASGSHIPCCRRRRRLLVGSALSDLRLNAIEEAGRFPVTFSTYLDRVHPDEQADVRTKIEGALGDITPFRFHHRIVRPDGETRYVRCQGEPVLDPATKKIVRVVGVCQDVTELASVERARSEADARFRSAFENAPIGIALLDFSEGADGRLTEVNRALTDLTGRTPDELIGSTLTGLCLAEDSAGDESLRERLLKGEIERFTVEKRSLLSDDRLVWLELSVSTVPTDGSARTAGIVQVQDVTERKRFEDKLRYIADHDSLTGLMNRRRFRSTDILARLAGDEFAVLLQSTEAQESLVLADALIARLADDEVASWGVVRLGWGRTIRR